MSRPRVGDQFQVECHDTRGALVSTTVTAERVVRSAAFPDRYRIETSRPGAPSNGERLRLAFIVSCRGQVIT